MSKQCPFCGHYNTELKVTGVVGYSALQGVRIFAAAAASMVVGVFNHSAGHSVIHNTEKWGEKIERHHCCNCGNDFI